METSFAAKKRSSVKEFLFKLEPWKIGVAIAAVVAALVFLLFKVVSGAAGFVNWRLLIMYVVLTLVLTFSRMTRFTSVGLRFSYFILFFVTITLGPVTAIILRLFSVPIRLWLFLADVPFKSFLKTKEDKIGRQVLYSIVSVSVMWVFVKIISLSVVLSKVVFYYMILYVAWTVLLLLLKIIFPYMPLAKAFMASGVALLFNWWLVKMFGMGLYNYLAGFV